MPANNQISLTTPFGNGDVSFIDIPADTEVTVEKVVQAAIGADNLGQSRIRLTRPGQATRTLTPEQVKTTPLKAGDEVSATPKTTRGAEGEAEGSDAPAPMPEAPASETQSE